MFLKIIKLRIENKIISNSILIKNNDLTFAIKKDCLNIIFIIFYIAKWHII
jgi:hypothetical protein